MANRKKPKKISTAQAAGAAIKGLLEMGARSNTGMAGKAGKALRGRQSRIEAALGRATDSIRVKKKKKARK